uniref:Uncharacterized protein n=1 Tax=Micrurus surinamensis TaxID=129470 RepID=A0A2D4PY16_MICSU
MPKDNIFHSCETTYFLTLLLKLLPFFFSTLNPLSENFWRPRQCIGSEPHRVYSGFLVNSSLVPLSSMTVFQPCTLSENKTSSPAFTRLVTQLFRRQSTGSLINTSKSIPH